MLLIRLSVVFPRASAWSSEPGVQKQQTTYSTIKPVKVVALQDPQEYYDFFKIVGQNAKKAKIAKNACQNKTSITNPSRVGGRRCSPPGGFQLNKSIGVVFRVEFDGDVR